LINETTNWQELREFKAVDLTQSFVLSWEANTDSLLIDVDLFLCQEHPFYERPRPSDQACFRPAHLEFPCCSAIFAAESGAGRSIAESIKHLGAGRISDLRRTGEGQYEIIGNLGVIAVSAERPMVRLKDTTI
jgi:hypothetical protein